jgi:hypothetical protein
MLQNWLDQTPCLIFQYFLSALAVLINYAVLQDYLDHKNDTSWLHLYTSYWAQSRKEYTIVSVPRRLGR